MFEQINEIIEKEEIITPVKFMQKSDVIYAGILPDEEFKKLDKINILALQVVMD